MHALVSRRSFIGATGAAAAAAGLPTIAFAQTWPDKPVKLVITYPAGGTVDAVARGSAPSCRKRSANRW